MVHLYQMAKVQIHVWIEEETRRKLRAKYDHGELSRRIREYLERLCSEDPDLASVVMEERVPPSRESYVPWKMNPVTERFLQKGGKR